MQGVGKSCLVLRYVRNTFDANSKITVSQQQGCQQIEPGPTTRATAHRRPATLTGAAPELGLCARRLAVQALAPYWVCAPGALQRQRTRRAHSGQPPLSTTALSTTCPRPALSRNPEYSVLCHCLAQVGAAFMSHNVALPDGQSLKFEIWDTAGQVCACVCVCVCGDMGLYRTQDQTNHVGQATRGIQPVCAWCVRMVCV